MTHNKSFLSIGECMIELSANGPMNYKMSYAGDTFNTAWYMRKALPTSWQVSFLSCVGIDTVSDSMVSFMQNAGISTKNIARIPGKSSGLYMIHLEKGERSFSYWRENSAARNLASDPARLENAFQSAAAIYFSGITVAILPEEDRETLLNSLLRARNSGRKVIFDPNLRPNLWPDTDVMCREVSRAASVADIVLPSFDDEALHFGDHSLQHTIERYHDLGAELVVLKNGSGEILAAESESQPISYVPELILNTIDTTAAGDSFNAGFLAAFLSGDAIESAIRQGSQLSAKVIQNRGALVDLV